MRKIILGSLKILIAGGIGTVITIYWLPIISYLKYFVSSIWKFLTSSYPIIVWQLIVLVILAALFIILAIYLIYLIYKEGFTYLNYTEDSFYALKWRWEYNDDDDTKNNISSYCSECDMQLTYYEIEGFFRIYTEFYCDHCNQKSGEMNKRENEIIPTIEKHIDRNIRLKKWF